MNGKEYKSAITTNRSRKRKKRQRSDIDKLTKDKRMNVSTFRRNSVSKGAINQKQPDSKAMKNWGLRENITQYFSATLATAQAQSNSPSVLNTATTNYKTENRSTLK